MPYKPSIVFSFAIALRSQSDRDPVQQVAGRRRVGNTPDQIRSGLDTLSLDTPEGHYTFTPEKHYGLPDSASLMQVVRNAQFDPADASLDELARAGL